MDVYVSAASLKARVAPGSSGLDDRLTEAVILGSRYVDRYLGVPVSTDAAEAPYSVDVVPCDPLWTAAALNAAAFYYKLGDAPLGYVGGLADYAVKIKGVAIPTADAILYGLRPPLIA